MRQSFLTKYIGKRINVKKEEEIVSKNLFRIHSKQKSIIFRLLEWQTEPDSALLYLVWQAAHRAGARIPPGIEF